MTPKSERVDKLSSVKNYFREYCNSTSIHGFRYFGENRSLFEKLWWAVIFMVCLSGCGFLIYTVYKKYERSPVIVTFATKETSIYKIPFPAVTICPETKSARHKFNYTEILFKKIFNKTTPAEDRQFAYMSFVCDGDKMAYFKNFFNDFFNYIDEVKPNFLDHTRHCSFMGRELNCEEIFIPIMTDEGVCYSFNILDRSQIFNDFVDHFRGYHKTKVNQSTWSIDRGYFQEFELNTYPKRALLAGASNGLTIHLATPKSDIDMLCKNIQGFRVVLHTPMRMPRLKQEYFRIPLDQAVVTAVTPVMISTSEIVKTYNIKKRDCCFPFERKLLFFRSYSQLNCQLECLTNFTLEVCGCVDIYMPRGNNTKICGIAKFGCMKDAENQVQSQSLFKNFEINDKRLVDCDCVPLCTDLTYQSEISQTNWNWQQKYGRNNKDQDLMHLSSLTVYFKFNHFITSERNELYGPTDFLANFGGLLGLFTGFSILSLMEIIYFLTLRICCNVKMYGNWSNK